MIIHKLQESSGFSSQEKRIAAYIFESPMSVREHTARELAQQLFISPSTLTRFCKKLGFSGDPDFLIHFVQESFGNDRQENRYFPDATVRPHNAPSLLEGLYDYTIEQTKLLIPPESFTQIVTRLRAAPQGHLHNRHQRNPKFQTRTRLFQLPVFVQHR